MVTEVALDFVLWTCMRRYLRFRFTAHFVFSTLIALGAMCCAVFACDMFIEAKLLCIIVSVLVGAAIYAAAAVLLKNEVALMFLRKLSMR